MKTLRQLIEQEQRANQAADDRLRCFAINKFGDGEHPYADSESLQYFAASYVRECLRRCAASDRVTEQARERARRLNTERKVRL